MTPTLRLSVALTMTALISACDHTTTGPQASAVSLASVATGFSDWTTSVNIEQATPGAASTFNTDVLDGCPFTSRDGTTFYMASTRPGGRGGIDIWVSHRASTRDAWGTPVNAGDSVNSSADDFCPTIDRDGHRFFFVSTRAGGCGGADIYVTRLRANGEFDGATNLGCDVNSDANEASPFPLPERASGPVLYFSSTRSRTGATGGDLYRSESHGGDFAPAELVPGVNSDVDDGQPNVRRDGLELFFYSTRPGTIGGPDLYSAHRPSTSAPWSTPVNLGSEVNTAANETRPSLSWDGTTLYFGSTRPASQAGSSDIYVTTRQRLGGADE